MDGEGWFEGVEERGCQENQELSESMLQLVRILRKHPQEKTCMWWL